MADQGSTRVCFLRKSEVVLADGRTYIFRALPLNRRTMPIVRAMMDDKVSDVEKLEAFLGAVELSMGYDQSAEVIEEALDSGLVDITNEKVMGALVAGFQKKDEG